VYFSVVRWNIILLFSYFCIVDYNNDNMKGFLKEYWLSASVLLVMAIIVTCSTKGTVLSHNANTKESIVTQDDTNADESDIQTIDIPSPLQNVSEQILYRKGYVVSYNKDTKIPNWVAWHLTSNHTTGSFKRSGNAFHEDVDVPLPRANNYDYKDSGWSRGHMCPAGDNKWNSDAMYESFLFTNVCPQNRNLNSGVWNQIEISCRNWADRYGDVFIVCGPILFNQEHETIGQTHVVVPEAFFKVVLCLNGEPKGIGFICRNTDGNRKKDLYVNSIRQVERITKMKFFPHLDNDVAEKVKNQSDLSEW